MKIFIYWHLCSVPIIYFAGFTYILKPCTNEKCLRILLQDYTVGIIKVEVQLLFTHTGHKFVDPHTIHAQTT